MNNVYELTPSIEQKQLLKKTASASLRVYNLILKAIQQNPTKWVSVEVDVNLLAHSLVFKDRALNVAKYTGIEIRSLDFAEQLALAVLDKGDEKKIKKSPLKNELFYNTCSKYLRVENGQLYIPKIGFIPIEVPKGVLIPQISNALFLFRENKWYVKFYFN